MAPRYSVCQLIFTFRCIQLSFLNKSLWEKINNIKRTPFLKRGTTPSIIDNLYRKYRSFPGHALIINSSPLENVRKPSSLKEGSDIFNGTERKNADPENNKKKIVIRNNYWNQKISLKPKKYLENLKNILNFWTAGKMETNANFPERSIIFLEVVNVNIFFNRRYCQIR